MNTPQEPGYRPARRTVVAAVGAVSVAAVLTSCGGTNGSDGSDAVRPADSGGGPGGGTVLAKTSDIPEGGGKVFGDQGVVVTQPRAGEFRAFSSKCTHQGCAVSAVTNGAITCPCHGSAFDAATGAVTAGPATRPLPPAKITVEGDSLTLPS